VNVGDSAACLYSGGKAKILHPIHNFSNPEETKKIEDRGGFIIKSKGIGRLFGNFSLSRSFGDLHYKDYITAEPYIGLN
jgi:protein phosphatase 1L